MLLLPQAEYNPNTYLVSFEGLLSAILEIAAGMMFRKTMLQSRERKRVRVIKLKDGTRD
jgi:hypothetical protein